MVLLSSEHGFAEALGFCEELRKVVPKQWVALLAVRRETYKKWQPCEYGGGWPLLERMKNLPHVHQ
jgi:hypothetical protein